VTEQFVPAGIYLPMSRLLTRLRVYPVLLAAALLTACASPIVTKVTNFNQWPADAAGSSFSFIRPPVSPFAAPNELEQAAYESYAQTELEKQGLKRATAAQPGRLLVELNTSSQTLQRTYLQPIYQEPSMVFIPSGRYGRGYWAPSRFGPAYLGDRVVPYTVELHRLSVRLLDTHNSPVSQPRAVFESRAVYEGQADLATAMPYLVRAALDGFPGHNGQVRQVKFDRDTGALIQKQP
jgi:hypothetical protein